MHTSNLMKKYLLPATCLIGTAAMASAEWTKVADFEDYNQTTDEAEFIAQGWIFQDWDYYGYPECVDGTKDCTGYRAVVAAPFGGSGNVFEIRAGDPTVNEPVNSRSITAFPLPVEIPVNGTATFYQKVAFERPEAAHHWGLTVVAEPVNGPDEPHHGYGDLGTSTATDFFGNQLPRVHQGGWVGATEDLDGVMVPEIWYEFWYHISNNDQSLGSGVFELYIRGGVYEEITHLPNYTLPQDLIDAGVTVWQFRNRVEEPITRWLNVTNTGNPAERYNGVGAMYIDDMYIALDEFTLEVPDGGTVNPDTWAGYPVLESGDCDTGSLLGWVNVNYKPYIFSYSLNQWMYIDESAVSSSGAWAYVFSF